MVTGMRSVPLTEARAHLSRLIEEASTKGERIQITRNGVPVAALLGVDDYDAIIETVAVLSDASLVAEIGKGLGDLKRGDTFSADEVREGMRTRGPKE